MKNENEVLTVGMFKELLGELLAPEFGKIHQEFVKVRDEMHELRDEMRLEFKNVRSEMAEGFRKVRIELRDDIIDVIDQNIQPQLTSAVSRITRLERKTA